jgi:hypothetical protein
MSWVSSYSAPGLAATIDREAMLIWLLFYRRDISALSETHDGQLFEINGCAARSANRTFIRIQ